MPKAPPEKDLETDTETPNEGAPQAGGDLVEVTITKFGEGKVSTGVHVAESGDIYAKRGDKIMVSPEVAKRLEILGVAEAD